MEDYNERKGGKLMAIRLFSILIPFFALTLGPVTAAANDHHPEHPLPKPVFDYCECDALSVVADSDPVLLETLCDAQWTTPGMSWSKYGAAIEYEAEWMVAGSELTSESTTRVDGFECTFENDEVCNAEDVAVVIQDHPVDANVTFYIKLKGFDRRVMEPDEPGAEDGEPGDNGKKLGWEKGKGKAKGRDKEKGKKSRDFVKAAAECTFAG